jgi:hypothetical protein
MKKKLIFLFGPVRFVLLYSESLAPENEQTVI